MPTVVPRPVPVRMARSQRSASPPSPRLLTIPRRSSGVARCLFGPPDPKDTMMFAHDEIRKEQKRLADKYNFDFETETPLPGNFVYEPMDDVPDCLKDVTVCSPKKSPEDVAQRKITEFIRVTKPTSSTSVIVGVVSKQLRKRRTTAEEAAEVVPTLAKSPRIDTSTTAATVTTATA